MLRQSGGMGYFESFPRHPSRSRPVPQSPDGYIADVFSVRSAQAGGVVRRKVGEVERVAGRAPFLAYCRAHGFQVIENNGHFIVFCNRAPVSFIN